MGFPHRTTTESCGSATEEPMATEFTQMCVAESQLWRYPGTGICWAAQYRTVCWAAPVHPAAWGRQEKSQRHGFVHQDLLKMIPKHEHKSSITVFRAVLEGSSASPARIISVQTESNVHRGFTPECTAENTLILKHFFSLACCLSEPNYSVLIKPLIERRKVTQ